MRTARQGPKPEPDIKTKEVVVEALAVIQRSYVDGDRLKYDEVFKRSIIGMLRALDPRSDLYDNKEFDEQKAGPHKDGLKRNEGWPLSATPVMHLYVRVYSPRRIG